MSYHHGDLRAAILTSAADMVARRGATELSLRELAREAGVSHAAPAHHFGDRRGLFTALAADGFTRLADALDGAHPDFHAAALAYVEFALANPGHYSVMFEPALLDLADGRLAEARDRAAAALDSGIATLTPQQTSADRITAARAAWSLVHGFVSLWTTGALADSRDDADPLRIASQIAYVLFPEAG
ncbi:TetR/AcrR family transcriptional regulator [Mycobacteroides abscessus]|uniref:TetR-family transcriptional regulator n=5 Tax=Mycobacteroides abscessus TaxID=36809 RepID=B1MGR4_MYCA9|nr:TetR/AcrR family transcriptional regulator [Mycobacteroides abscessus]ETZ87602.1 putative transcriptional regulator [Mycobacteroides abscessus MAB_030201_1075]ETZ93262.1 putative transcriptional regulator [Mycobacteroides abscessus MAB_030201_1061]EUA46773.1 putative transcriptional regulator [Mycobacteroides abscessus 21]EUA64307.1 putative transcriptional regulator [Mycobacteroides abscessus 1948]AKP56754.1 TetR family transcriptional regulator [Mycobacteroides abscessus UC22]